MGIMPSTGRIYGASKETLLNPNESIRVSVRCLMDTEKSFRDIANLEERLKFTLGGYNAGVGHVQDAQRLASKYGYDAKVWTNNVERFILLKREAKYYTDPVCRSGYLRGTETVRYADEVAQRYQAGALTPAEQQFAIDSIQKSFKSYLASHFIYVDPKSPAAYFALYQRKGNVPYFSIYEEGDDRAFAAVATAYELYYPEAPYLSFLKDEALKAIAIRRIRRGESAELTSPDSLKQ